MGAGGREDAMLRNVLWFVRGFVKGVGGRRRPPVHPAMYAGWRMGRAIYRATRRKSARPIGEAEG